MPVVRFPASEGTFPIQAAERVNTWNCSEPWTVAPNLETLLEFTENLLLIEPVSEEANKNVLVKVRLNTGLLKASQFAVHKKIGRTVSIQYVYSSSNSYSWD